MGMDETYGYLKQGTQEYVDKYDQYMQVEFEYCCRTFIQYDRYPFRMEFCNPDVNEIAAPMPDDPASDSKFVFEDGRWKMKETDGGVNCKKVARPGFYKEDGLGDPEHHKEYFRATVAHVCCHHMQQKRCKGDYLECITGDYTYTG